MSTRIGIMQGRLLPPVDGKIQAFPKERWSEEFPLAQQLGFDTIEFIFDGAEDAIPAHPLLADGCSQIRELTALCNVGVATVCADYFMAHPVHDADAAERRQNVRLLRQLVESVAALGVTDIVLPCVDQSTLASEEDRERLIRALVPVLPLCEAKNVNLALETDLEPQGFRDLLDQLPSASVRVNYDVGNSAALGYDPIEEWEAYGEKVSTVHIKDRKLHGSTVPLGVGAARFEDFFQVARKKGYGGGFVIQGARGPDDVSTAAQYRLFVQDLLTRYFRG